MFFSSKKSVLGVDIGTSNLKVAQITTKGEEHHLDTYGLVNIPFDINDNTDATIIKIADVLKKLIQHANVTTNQVVASLPNSSVFTSVIEMPKLSEKELENAVEFEAKKYVPIPMSECTLSWSSLEKRPDGRSTVLITAVPNSILNSYKRIFELANLDPFALEIESLALIRSIIGNDPKTILLIDIGAKSTHLGVTEKGSLVLTRNVPVGGDTITQKIAESLKISKDRAEQFKKDFGLNRASVIPDTIKQILMVIKTEAMQLQSIYKARNQEFDKIIVVGGAANLPGLNEFFSDLGPPVEKGNSLERLTYSSEIKPLLNQYAANLAVAIGLALRTEK